MHADNKIAGGGIENRVIVFYGVQMVRCACAGVGYLLAAFSLAGAYDVDVPEVVLHLEADFAEVCPEYCSKCCAKRLSCFL